MTEQSEPLPNGDPPTHSVGVQLDALGAHIPSLSLHEAAELYGVTPKTIRRRIKLGTLPGLKHPTAQGFEWRVVLDEDRHLPAQGATQDKQVSTQDGHLPTQSDAAEIALKALSLVEQLQRDNQQLAGQVGFLQAKLQDAQEEVQQLRLLMAPREEPIESDRDRDQPNAAPAKRPWWKVWGR